MIRRSTKIVVSAVLFLVAAGGILLGVAAWRLSEGPLRADFLTPYLESAVTTAENGLSTEIGNTVLTWEGWSRNVDLRVLDVTVRNRERRILARLPDIAVTLSIRALLEGVIAPTRIELLGAQVRLVRNPAGQFEFGQALDQAETEDSADFSTILPKVLDDLLAKRDPADPLAYLNVLQITDGRLIINDRMLDVYWRAPSADISLRRHPLGLAGQVSLEVAIGTERARVESSILYDHAKDHIEASAMIAELQPSALALVVPSLASLSGINVPITGSISASLNPRGRLHQANFNLAGGPGEISIAEIMPQPMPVESVAANGQVDKESGRLDLESATLRLGTRANPGPAIAMTANAHETQRNLAITAEVRTTDVTMQDLNRFWPEGFAKGARNWILENIKKGRTETASARASLQAPDGNLAHVHLQSLEGELRYRDLAVHYLRPLPPVTGVSGIASFDEKSFTLRPTGGHLDDLTVGESEIIITGLDAPDQSIAIRFPVSGPLKQAVALLAQPRLDLMAHLGLGPDDVEGNANVEAEFRFPLVRDLTFEQVDVSVTAKLEQVRLSPSLLGRPIDDGNLLLKVTESGLQASGTLSLDRVPAKVDWIENFEEDPPFATRITVDTDRSEGAAQALLGVDLKPYVTGPLSGALEFTEARGGLAEVDVSFDLAGATISVPFLAYTKETGRPASAELAIELEDMKPTSVRRFAVSAPDLSVKGSAEFGASEEEISEAQLTELKVGRTELRDVWVVPRTQGFEIQIGGGVVDATPFLSDAEAGEDPDDKGPQQSFSLSAPNLTKVLLGQDRYLEQVLVELERSAESWNLIRVEGQIPAELRTVSPPQGTGDGGKPAPGSFRLDFGPDEGGQTQLYANSDDMGAVLRLFDILGTVRGGRIEVSGLARGAAGDRTIKGKIEAHDYTLVDVPIMARLLTLASLTGILDVLQGEGIGFQRLVGDYTLRDDVVSSDLMRAYGPALGITAKGTIDLSSDTVDVNGTIVPAYTVNRILGEIPLLGPLLTGGKGEGIIGVNYGVSGKLGHPDVSVNPLSALTPGFLRRIFDVFEGGGAGRSGDSRPDSPSLPDR